MQHVVADVWDRELLDELEQHGHPLIVSVVTGTVQTSHHSAGSCQNVHFRHDKVTARALHVGYDLDAAR